MSLSEKLSAQVESGVRNRGRNYYLDGKVRIQESGDDFIQANVKGTETYAVTLDREHGILFADCTCPYFEGGVVCKHIWAAILAADSSLMLTPKPNEKSIQLITDRESYCEPDLAEESDPDENTPLTAQALFRKNIYHPSLRFIQPAPTKPTWKEKISTLAHPPPSIGGKTWPARMEIQYQINIMATLEGDGLSLSLSQHLKKNNGEWGKRKKLRLTPKEIRTLPDPSDRNILTILGGASNSYYDYGWSPYDYQQAIRINYVLPDGLRDMLLPMICETGRCLLYNENNGLQSILRVDPGAPWNFRLEVVNDKPDSDYHIRGYLERDNERRDLDTPKLLVAGGWVFWEDHAARLNDANSFNWISLLRQQDHITVPHKDAHEIPETLYSLPSLPTVTLPAELKYNEIRVTPKPQLTVLKPRHKEELYTLSADLKFDYAGTILAETQAGGLTRLNEERSVIIRDMNAENTAKQTLLELGLKHINYPDSKGKWEFSPRRLPEIVSTLMTQNWKVEAEGRLYKKPGAFNINVTSGMDWFELRASVKFDDVSIDLPALLKALKNKENTIVLSDGSIGMLPEEWLKKYGVFAALGAVTNDHVRFQKNQAGVLDALLAAQPEATCDEIFGNLRIELKNFESILPADPTGAFTGTLRDYQKDGLGWLGFLQKFNFGGCLADDMGLGKTVQVLAMLEARRKTRSAAKEGEERIPPSLIVVPRSLIFNWKQESEKFTPKMRILDHSGLTRRRSALDFKKYDLVLTTYGTLRRDIEHLKDIAFDYVILDEAQAIKNAQAQTAKATRLLKCSYRLAMSGTPVQNHLGDLWSLFEFLNPGMLGRATVFSLTEAAGRNPSNETRSLLARALKPFILRRTKSQVAKDLPERTEETLYCELDKTQRKLYNELRDHYRLSLKTKIETEGINKSKIMILEALLRLRQAACHPGLIDKERSLESSAKLEALLPQISEVIEEGHKALIFSQFTSFLSILCRKLDAEKIRYEYLDGQTHDRESRVNTFQNDPNCRLFLISLKAGGLGLNLTAAEYVFLLDPWWNPAVEMQAIDRAHRIGQTQHVFAYRLIAKDTVEEKVLELQKSKKELADSIIDADSSLIRTLSREDLELLLA